MSINKMWNSNLTQNSWDPRSRTTVLIIIFFFKGLSDDLESVEDTYDLVEVFHKHKDDPVAVKRACVQQISIVNYELQEQNIKVFHSTISQIDFLKSLKLHYCGDSDNLKKFLDGLKNMDCQV